MLKKITLLSIEEDPVIQQQIDLHLEGIADEILHAFTAESGLKIAFGRHPDIILLGDHCPDRKSTDVLRSLKEAAQTRDVPVIFFADGDRTGLVAKALDYGASDFVTRPFIPIELQSRVRAALRTRQLIDLLKEQTRIDGLSGLNNSLAFEESLKKEVADFHRRGLPLGLLLVEIHNLEELNDRHGYRIGDEAIRAIGQMIREGVRISDHRARIGGVRFAVLFTCTDRDCSLEAARRILDSVRNIEIPKDNGSVAISVRGGLTFSPRRSRKITTAEFLSAAESALAESRDDESPLIIRELE